MEKYILNCAALNDRESAHDELIRALPLPAYYGRNLDALWDEASCMEAEILLENAADVDGYGEIIIGLLKEAAEENPRLKLIIQA